jgi:putative transposase
VSQRRSFVEPDGALSVRRQCEILALNRSSLYYESIGPDPEELELMRRIDELHLEFPFYGSRRISRELRSQGLVVNRKRVQRLMRIMGLEALAPKPNTSQPAPEHPVYPYLLRKLSIGRPNQVWAADITYVPLAHGFAYLVAIMDWYSRRVLSWRLSNSLDTSFCVEALEDALARFGRPEIFNTDQGSQFTSEAFTQLLLDRGVKISMDGKGRSILGIVNVQWVCPTSSITSSASKAPKAAPRFAQQDGQSPRVLQENANRYSSRQDGHRTRAAPRS